MVVGNVEHRGLFPFSPHTFWCIAWRKKCFGNEILQKSLFYLGFSLCSSLDPAAPLMVNSDMVLGNVEHRGLFPFSPHTFWGIAWWKKCLTINFFEKSLIALGFGPLTPSAAAEIRHGCRKCGALRPFHFPPTRALLPTHTFWDIAWRKKSLTMKVCLIWGLHFIPCSWWAMQLKVLRFGGRKCRPFLSFPHTQILLDNEFHDKKFVLLWGLDLFPYSNREIHDTLFHIL